MGGHLLRREPQRLDRTHRGHRRLPQQWGVVLAPIVAVRVRVLALLAAGLAAQDCTLAEARARLKDDPSAR